MLTKVDGMKIEIWQSGIRVSGENKQTNKNQQTTTKKSIKPTKEMEKSSKNISQMTERRSKF